MFTIVDTKKIICQHDTWCCSAAISGTGINPQPWHVGSIKNKKEDILLFPVKIPLVTPDHQRQISNLFSPLHLVDFSRFKEKIEIFQQSISETRANSAFQFFENSVL
jgi:hypothetical protein